MSVMKYVGRDVVPDQGVNPHPLKRTQSDSKSPCTYITQVLLTVNLITVKIRCNLLKKSSGQGYRIT